MRAKWFLSLLLGQIWLAWESTIPMCAELVIAINPDKNAIYAFYNMNTNILLMWPLNIQVSVYLDNISCVGIYTLFCIKTRLLMNVKTFQDPWIYLVRVAGAERGREMETGREAKREGGEETETERESTGNPRFQIPDADNGKHQSRS